MLKQVIRLTKPGVFLPFFVHEPWPDAHVVVRPTFLSICAADQRYFRGDRPETVLRSKLPMALLHEAVGEVLHDPAGRFSPGDKVVFVPCATPAAPSGGNKANYSEGGLFHSSNCDGFAQELLVLPHSQLVPVPPAVPGTAPASAPAASRQGAAPVTPGQPEDAEKMYVFSELMSVGVHAVKRWLSATQDGERELVGVWGDGAFSFILCLVLRALSPETRIAVFGKHDKKLAFFSFVHEVVNIASRRPMRINHGFECVGGGGSEYAIREIIDRVYPQGLIFLLGVSEVEPPIHTRLILEKGLTMIGCSRSTYADFQCAADLIARPEIQGNLRKIISKDRIIRNSTDLEHAFREDVALDYKTVLQWKI